MRNMILAAMTASAAAGCVMTGPDPFAERSGKVYYLDGAGNLGGGRGVPDGLRDAGYLGDIQVFTWTTTHSPLLDQLAAGAARSRGPEFAGVIADYLSRHPDNEVDVIALSAGTGVAVWGVESLPEGVRIRNLVLLGSSLTAGYDMRDALGNMTGAIYNYHAPDDLVLRIVPAVGSIDGVRGEAAAGSVGLAVPPGAEGRIVNIRRTEELSRRGWRSHVGAATRSFVREVVSRHVVAQ